MKPFRMRYLFLLLVTWPLFAQKFTIIHNGEKRKYTVFLPQDFNPVTKHPLVLNIHGLGANRKQQEKYSRMNKVADKEGFIVIYPYGNRHYWNTGVLKEPYITGRDDVGFINKILDTVIQEYNVATDSIYATGLSLGGYFSHRLACEMGNRIAAIASVGGAMSDSTNNNCSNPRPIPVLQIHGTKDPIVKYNGFRRSMPVEKTVAFWAKRNSCSSSDTVLIPDICSKDQTTASLIKFKCDSKAPVWFVKIHNGGHTWPGTRIDYLFLGKTNMDFKASELIWEFFSQFSLKQ